MRFQALKDIKSKYWVSAHQESQTSVTRSKASAEFFISLCLPVLEMTISQHTAVCNENTSSFPLCFYCNTQFEVSEWKKRPLVQITFILPHPWKWKRGREISRNVIHHHYMTSTKNNLWRFFTASKCVIQDNQSMYIQIKQLDAKSAVNL